MSGSENAWSVAECSRLSVGSEHFSLTGKKGKNLTPLSWPCILKTKWITFSFKSPKTDLQTDKQRDCIKACSQRCCIQYVSHLEQTEFLWAVESQTVCVSITSLAFFRIPYVKPILFFFYWVQSDTCRQQAHITCSNSITLPFSIQLLLASRCLGHEILCICVSRQKGVKEKEVKPIILEPKPKICIRWYV